MKILGEWSVDRGILREGPSCRWVDLEGIMLSEINQTEDDKYYAISLICGIYKHTHKNKTETKQKTTKLTEKEIRLVVTTGGWKGNQKRWPKVTHFQL